MDPQPDFRDTLDRFAEFLCTLSEPDEQEEEECSHSSQSRFSLDS